MKTLHAFSFGAAAAIVGASIMLVLGILGNLGMYLGAVEMMEKWHMFFSLSLIGILLGMIEAAIVSFIILYPFAILYNWLIAKN